MAIETFSEYMKIVLNERAKERAKDFKKEICNYINACEEDGGVPIFQTKFAGVRFEDGIILAKCWLGKNKVDGEWFKNVPKEDIEKMERTKGDVKWIKPKYCKI